MKMIAILVCVCASIFSAEIIKEEKLPYHVITKLEFDGHTYIHLKNIWNNAGNSLMHDPGCKCLKNKTIKNDV